MKKPILFLLLIPFLVHADASMDESPVVTTVGRYLCIDHQPFFPLGLYHFPDKRTDDAIWKEVADAGFNFVLSDQPGKYGVICLLKNDDNKQVFKFWYPHME